MARETSWATRHTRTTNPVDKRQRRSQRPSGEVASDLPVGISIVERMACSAQDHPCMRDEQIDRRFAEIRGITEPDWDGCGARVPDPRVVEYAERFLRAWFKDPNFWVGATVTGGVVIEAEDPATGDCALLGFEPEHIDDDDPQACLLVARKDDP